jgi:nitroimidazol reductase NimA-like FMN-containing flavoprotein (pyridoxamine 5'-phosphate oxidase superfamily)
MISKDEPILEKKDETKDYNPDLVENIRKMLNSQPFSVLCTQGDQQPYGSLIAFAFSRDLKHFFFTTPTATRKYMLLSKCPRVSLLIDTRSNHPDDMQKIQALTITGIAHEIKKGNQYQNGVQMLTERHPYMKNFLEAESTALFRIDVKRYLHVTRFQEVSQWIP